MDKTKLFLKEVKKYSKDKETPFLVLNLDLIKRNYESLQKQMPFAQIYYAVKANPHKEVLSLLNKKGSNFDVATIYELQKLLQLGVTADKISFGNTIKKHQDIAYFYKKGVRLFVTDSHSDLKKIAHYAPKSNVFFRLSVDGAGADWELSKKFGAHHDLIIELAQEAKKVGLKPYGLSFHVGSQQRDVEQWDNALSQCKSIFKNLEHKGINLKMINLGGGLPSQYLIPTPSLTHYTKKIAGYLKKYFGKDLPKILIEPGRYMVGNSGIIVTETILIAKKSESLPHKWLYVDAGIYQGLDECIAESLEYPIKTEKNSLHKTEYIIAGPTCDSHDILYERRKYKLSSSIKEGSRVYFLSTGAYSYQVSSIEFNGFPPLKVYILEDLKRSKDKIKDKKIKIKNKK
ncbi:ornithine decarboxylase [Candidatus Woesearchaeota archaeon CG_4_10_14_0_2_um_filter_33_13]|nr:MAG: ornithine decarboxylase [Candidatus Woesearchaeota archaeon CG_4_10_14_0_2_um_filter_33_13]